MAAAKRKRPKKRPKPKAKPRRSPSAGRRRRVWAKLPTDKLLDVRLCDLGVRIERSRLGAAIRQVLGELERRGIRLKPHFWISDDWFTPHGIPGCAVPFYLLHPRLMRLERSRMLEVEGSDRTECLKLLRHELGHAVDHAYRLNLRRDRHRLFGKSSKPYPKAYRPRPASRNYVRHLDYWYAQAHPDEDFAETFAVWLSPRSNWRRAYEGWPVVRKLLYVDELMRDIADQRPRIASRARVDPLDRMKKTLRQYYEEKQKRYGADYPDFFDADLRRLFSDALEDRANETAASFLRRIRPEIRHTVSQWTGHHEYTLDQVLRDVIGRCRQLKLRIAGSPQRTKMDAAIMLTVSSMNFVYHGRRWIDV